MALVFYLSVVLCLWVATTSSSPATNESLQLPDGVLHMECRDRYFMAALNLSFTEEDPQFVAVDGTGMFPIVGQYAAECGYMVTVLPLQNRMELTASYFSCHTHNEDDKVFTLSFHLLATHEQKTGKEAPYTLNKTCSLSLPWSPREITCEENYMEVSVKSDVTCGLKADFWSTMVQSAQKSSSAWSVKFHMAGQQTTTMSLVEARNKGYVFSIAHGRVVFRTLYGQPESNNTMVNDVPVEIIQATLFSKQSWVALMFDLDIACSMDEGSYEDGKRMAWETPETLFPGLDTKQISVGLGGKLVAQPVAENKGYVIERNDSRVQISIPYNAEGRTRMSIVSGELFEFFIFNLQFEQLWVDSDQVETRLRIHRALTTGLLRHSFIIDNRTVVEDRVFTVYLGNIPEGVHLAALELNGQRFMAPFTNTSTCEVEEEINPNATRGFTLKVSFDDPCVIKQSSSEDASVRYQLNVNYTLTNLPEGEEIYYMASFVAFSTNRTPPVSDAFCSETGITFRLEHQWEVIIGSDPLTSDLAHKHGYIMRNDSDHVLLEVPLLTQGYEYENITLEGFNGTFKILVRDQDSQRLTVKTCPFTAVELIVCSTDGMMTVIADLSLTNTSEGVLANTSLLDKSCRPREADKTRALFSFPVNSCGSTVKVSHGHVTYENKILTDPQFLPVTTNSSADATNPSAEIDEVTIRCAYPIGGLHRLFSTFRFESEMAVVGKLNHTATIRERARPTSEPTTVPEALPVIPEALPVIPEALPVIPGALPVIPEALPESVPAPGIVEVRAARRPSVQYFRVPSFYYRNAQRRPTDEDMIPYFDMY